jgi:hypothetical protein
MEDPMTAAQVFAIANPFALVGWIILAWAVLRRNDFLRDQVAGRAWPLLLSLGYVALIILFIGKSDGDFNSLDGVKILFDSDWLLLAGWIHYLAFDLFIGTWIARQAMALSMNRLWLIGLLPLTFLFGPAGLVAFEIAKLLATPTQKVTA